MLGHHGISEAPISALVQAIVVQVPTGYGLAYSAPAMRMHYDAEGHVHFSASALQAEYTAGVKRFHFRALDDEPEYSTEH